VNTISIAGILLLPSPLEVLGSGPGSPNQKPEVCVARLYRFVDVSGFEIHTIEDPDDRLPIPANQQVISIGSSSMQVESVASFGDTGACTMYFVRVRTAAGAN